MPGCPGVELRPIFLPRANPTCRPGVSPPHFPFYLTPLCGDRVGDEEPHALRRKAILKAHPEIRELYGPDPSTCPKVLAVVALQAFIGVKLQQQDASWLAILAATYVVGAFASQHLSLAVHEIAHNLCFDGQAPNKLMGIITNLGIGVPFSTMFQKYHMDHHRYQGHWGIDADVPSMAEAKLVGTNTFLKFLFINLQLLGYALRPIFTESKPADLWLALNWLAVVAFDAALVRYAGWKALGYVVLSTVVGAGLHPIAGHFISEHYTFEKGVPSQETYSYYGPLNFFVYNVGYHNEHHDFPRVPGSRLAKLKAIAPEFYDNLHCHTSWSMVLYRYITDPNVGPFSRVVRKAAQRHGKPAIAKGE